MEEIWKAIPNYEGSHEASNLGRIRSIDREVVYSNGRVYRLKSRVLRQSNGSGTYKVVNIQKSVKYVHQLVAMAFLGHVPNGHSLVVDHIDNDRQNNNLNNLSIVSNRENLSRRGGSSKYVGVYFNKSTNKWASKIRVGGKNVWIGRFKNEIDAHNAYQNKLKELSNG